MQTLVAWASVASNLAQALALVVGGVWAYYRFVRSRTFYSRVDWSFEIREIDVGERRMLHVRATLRNTSATRVFLDDPPVFQRLQFMSAADVVWAGQSRWRVVPPAADMPTQLFEPHTMLEPGEAVVDEMLVSLPMVDGRISPVAWRLTLTLFLRRRSPLGGRRRRAAWPVSTVVLPRAVSDGVDAT